MMTDAFNLKFLEEISAGDKEKLNKLMNAFMQEAPKACELLQTSYKAKNFDELYRAAHTVKPLYQSIGAEKATGVIKNLEDYSRSAFFRELIPVELSELERINKDIYEGMNNLLSKNQS